MDAISFLSPHTKSALRPGSFDTISVALRNAYRTCWYGRPGTSFVDFPADLIQNKSSQSQALSLQQPQISAPPKPSGNPETIDKVAKLLKSAQAPLIIIGKGAAYARAEESIRQFINNTQIPFLPTPMGKGVVPDSHPLNVSSARSAALKSADVVLLLGARLNWILHFGEAPRWSSSAKIVQVDIHPEEIGRNTGNAEFGLFGDINLVVDQLQSVLSTWRYKPCSVNSSDTYPSLLAKASLKNETRLRNKALKKTGADDFLTFQRAFHIIESTLNSLSPPEKGNIVYVAEGANTMDISRSVFQLQHPRQRLDAGTYATMGVGLGYMVAAHAAFNLSLLEGELRGRQPKKIVAFEGDSAFGFSAMEVETLARQQIPALIFVMNNSGIYHGDTDNEKDWRERQRETIANATKLSDTNDSPVNRSRRGLRSTSLLYNTRYEYLATMCGGNGIFVRTEEELEEATRAGFLETTKVTIVNVVVEPGIGQSIQFGWQASKSDAGQEAKL